MDHGGPSRTALGAARHRAAHQLLEDGAVFSDALAIRILGPGAEADLRETEADPSRRRLRLFIAARTRFAEDALATAIERGLRQLVVLGAGLDTYAYRTPFADCLRMFEVDHPATQAWKRGRLADAEIAVPAHLTFAPIDFERETLADGLGAAGFDSSQSTFFTWLGVVPYLTEHAVVATLRFISGLRRGTQVVFDYFEPAAVGEHDTPEHAKLAASVASIGEAFRSSFDTDALHARLRSLTFGEIEDLGPAQIVQRYFGNRPMRGTGDRGAHIIRAART